MHWLCCALQPVARNKNESGRSGEREREHNKEEFLVSRTVRRQTHLQAHSGSTGIIKIQHGDSVSQSHHISTCCAIFYSIVRKVASAVSQPSSRIRTKCGREEGFTPSGGCFPEEEKRLSVWCRLMKHSSCSKLSCYIETAGNGISY